MPRIGWRGNRLVHHIRHCRICRHSGCAEIERQFLNGISPRQIQAKWKFASYRAIYRHAHAKGLFARRGNLFHQRLACTAAVLGQIVEKVNRVPVTASHVIAAIRILYKIEGLEARQASFARPASDTFTELRITSHDGATPYNGNLAETAELARRRLLR